jgi:hypothetical protein
MTRLKTILILTTLIIAAGIVGTLDYENALLEEAAYCDRVKNKVHTDYDNLKDTCVARHWSK